MNSYVSPCITPVGSKYVVADGSWSTNANVISNDTVAVDTAFVLVAVAAAAVISIAF